MLALTLCFTALDAIEEATKKDIVKLENNILMAENYLWLTMDEGSFTKVDKKALKYIDISNAMLKNMVNADKPLYDVKIQSLKDQLYSLRAVEGKSLYGYFPLLKYTVSDFFFMRSDPKIHTLVKNPKYLGVHNAIQASTAILRQLHQRHIFINSVPHDSEAEEIAFNIFNGTDKLFSRLDKEVVTALENKKDIQNFRDKNITQTVGDKLCDYVGDDSIYLVTIIRNLTENNEYYYTITTSNYGYKGKNNLMSTDAFGYAIDESPDWPVIIFTHLILLMFVVSFTLYRSKKYTWDAAMLPLLLFVVGRVSPWIVIPALLAIKPGGDAHVLYSAWWVVLLGLAIFILPIIIVKLFYKKVLEYIALPNISGQGNIIGLSVAAGAISFLIIPFIYAYGGIATFNEVLAFVLFSIAVLVSGYILGKILDDNDKMDEKNLLWFVVTSGFLITTFLHGNSTYLNMASLLTIAMSGLILYLYNQKIKQETEESSKLVLEDDLVPDVECKDLENVDLKEMVLNPPYQKYDYYKAVFESTQPIYEGKATYCVLKGDGGAGKTVTAKILIDSVGRTFSENNKPVVFLSSNCERYDNDEIPYGMFSDLLDSTFSMDLFGQREKDEKFDKVINMASSFMMGPVASFLVSDDSGEQKSFSKNDIYIFVKNKLEELLKESTIILFVDDLQWIDSASKELLKYLMEEFSANSDNSIFFIFTVRDTQEGNEQLTDLNLNEVTHTVGYIDKIQQRQLLEKSFCISAKSAQWIVDWAADQNSDRIYPYILVDAVGNLVRSDVFEIIDDRFGIKDDFDFENPPIPEGPQKEVKQFLGTHPQYLEMLSFAAVLGKEFQVSHIASGLNISYLETVKTLDSITKESGFIFDLLDKDDVYQFRSQILLDALRATIGYSTDGMTSTHVAQSMRHFHALAAYALKQTLKDNKSSKLVMSVANHYYAAGKLHANEAVEHLLQAVETCRGLFEYDDAIAYLDKVDEVLSLTKKDTTKSETLRLLVEADKSNVQGVGANMIAEKLLTYLETHINSRDDLKLAATRAAYDAALQNNYSQEWFAKSAQIAKEYLLPSESTWMQAEGHHFIAICMKPQTDDEKQIQLDHFNNAISLTKEDYPTAYAKIANSFAESLSYGDDVSKEQAKELFLDSLRIKENAEIKDLPGMARTYGGLGRLAFFSAPSDIEEAESYFKKDLEIAEEINDQRGISQMNSFLGSCKKEAEKYEDAVEYYNKSIEMQNNPFDVHASYEGKLSCFGSMDDDSKLFDTVRTYVKVIDDLGTPPPFMVGKIVAVVEKYQEEDICKQLLEKLKQDTKK